MAAGRRALALDASSVIGATDTAPHSTSPGRSNTEQTALILMGRPASVDEVPDFLLWQATSRITFVTGQVVATSGGE